jgi:hypothetical protein
MLRQHLVMDFNIPRVGVCSICADNESMQRSTNVVHQLAIAMQDATFSTEKWNAEPVQIRQLRPETEGFPSGLAAYAGAAPSSGLFKLGQSPEKLSVDSRLGPRASAVTLWKTPPATSTASQMRSSAFRPFPEEEDLGVRRHGFIGNRSTRL